MSERYTKLFALPENQYAVGAPILIAAGALLKDNQTGKVLAQFKFKSISPKEIKAVKISVTAFDVSGKEVKGVAEYQYLDLSAFRDAEFGQKQAVPLPDAVTRTIGVECTGVVFEDGSVWEAPRTAQWKPLPKQTDLAQQLKDVSLVSQYRRDTTESARFAVLDYEDLWLCACGSVNHSDETKCHSCQQNKAALTAALDTETLKKHKAAYPNERRVCGTGIAHHPGACPLRHGKCQSQRCKNRQAAHNARPHSRCVFSPLSCLQKRATERQRIGAGLQSQPDNGLQVSCHSGILKKTRKCTKEGCAFPRFMLL